MLGKGHNNELWMNFECGPFALLHSQTLCILRVLNTYFAYIEDSAEMPRKRYATWTQDKVDFQALENIITLF